jgi:hypothetical protein
MVEGTSTHGPATSAIKMYQELTIGLWMPRTPGLDV